VTLIRPNSDDIFAARIKHRIFFNYRLGLLLLTKPSFSFHLDHISTVVAKVNGLICWLKIVIGRKIKRAKLLSLARYAIVITNVFKARNAPNSLSPFSASLGGPRAAPHIL